MELDIDDKEYQITLDMSKYELNHLRVYYDLLSNRKKIGNLGFLQGNNNVPYMRISIFMQYIMRDLMEFSSVLPDQTDIIFLPASRSGLMLLYNHFFEESTKKEMVVVETENTGTLENEFGLTKPVYDFMSFLQTYKDSSLNYDANKEIIDFINKELIRGELRKGNNTMLYTPEKTDIQLPSYLSSSMVNEISPLVQILTGIQKFRYIFYDEIETCQHPSTQIQMVRALVRMVNKGYHMIVSTHSDTMAAAINNLLMLSFADNREEKAEKLGYTEEDYLRTKKVHAYQFIDTGKGTVVQEVENFLNIGIGYDFTLFNGTNDKIIKDAETITEI